VEDVEAVRQGLVLGKITLLGHSYGGVLAQAYALKYQNNLSHLILCSTFASTMEMNQVLARIKFAAPENVREQIEREEKAGLYGQGRDYEKNRYTNEYMIAAGRIFHTCIRIIRTRTTTRRQSVIRLGICIGRCGGRTESS
jgi:pimeloyl-ACP methyl ester carboxylesterase